MIPHWNACFRFQLHQAQGQQIRNIIEVRRGVIIAIVAATGIALHLLLRFGVHASPGTMRAPLIAVLGIGGIPLVFELLRDLSQRKFSSDLLAGISIVTSVLLGEYLAGAIVVLMLAGGEALESYALRSASSVLRALANRMPSVAHRANESVTVDIALSDIRIDDRIEVYPHEICPVDGIVSAGNGVMNEAFLTGEPFEVTKAPGSLVISGAINGGSALTIVATKLAVDSRYAKIMEVMRESEQNPPRLRRLGDQLGAVYTPVAVAIAIAAWMISGDSQRFLAVLVIATPCPLLIAIPVAIIGSISLAARRSIIIRNPVALEQVGQCRCAIFDKTGTLTYGRPEVTEQFVAPDFLRKDVLRLAASLERYSKHPLARAILAQATGEGLTLEDATEVSEAPGEGLTGIVARHRVAITSRGKVTAQRTRGIEHLPAESGGLECVVVVDGQLAGTLRLRDAPRADGKSFIRHLAVKHHIERVMIVSGDRESEVRYFAQQVGVSEVHAEQRPEDKLAIVRRETSRAKTLYVGDGINDAPAMMAATVGIALGKGSDVTAEAADVVVMESSLRKVDEFLHISRRLRTIALQSAVGGIVLSMVGMLLAANGYLSPVAGAVSQEVIDVMAVLNALRAAFPPEIMSDID